MACESSVVPPLRSTIPFSGSSREPQSIALGGRGRRRGERGGGERGRGREGEKDGGREGVRERERGSEEERWREKEVK